MTVRRDVLALAIVAAVVAVIVAAVVACVVASDVGASSNRSASSSRSASSNRRARSGQAGNNGVNSGADSSSVTAIVWLTVVWDARDRSFAVGSSLNNIGMRPGYIRYQSRKIGHLRDMAVVMLPHCWLGMVDGESGISSLSCSPCRPTRSQVKHSMIIESLKTIGCHDVCWWMEY